MNILIPFFLNVSLLFGTSCTMKEASAKSLTIKEPTPAAIFNGKVMQSADGGSTWTDISAGLPEKHVIQAKTNDDNSIYFGSMESKVLSYNNNQPAQWKIENLKEMMIDMTSKHESIVNGVFSTGTSVYAFAVLEGLFRKKNGQRWLPISVPENVYSINDMLEDANGNLFLTSMNGIFRSLDGGKNWDHVYKGNWKGQLISNQGNIIVSGPGGLHSSSDNGTTWTRLTINKGATLLKIPSSANDEHSYNLIPWGEGIAVIRSDFPDKNAGTAKFQVSMDGGKTWKNHEADSYLSTLEGITSIIFDKGKLYCSYKDGVITSDNNGKSWKPILTYVPSQPNESLSIIKSGEILYCFSASMGC